MFTWLQKEIHVEKTSSTPCMLHNMPQSLIVFAVSCTLETSILERSMESRTPLKIGFFFLVLAF